jgi:hypothetical protein
MMEEDLETIHDIQSKQRLVTHVNYALFVSTKYLIYSMENMRGNRKQGGSKVPLSFPVESLL